MTGYIISDVSEEYPATLPANFTTNDAEHRSKPPGENLQKYGVGLLAMILWGSLSPAGAV